MLRHTYGRELVANKVDIATVAELLGHADVNVTR
jgi:integrase/recombinase XerD